MSQMWDEIAQLIEQDERRARPPQEPGSVYSQYEWQKYREHMERFTSCPEGAREQPRYSDGREVS